MTVAGVACICVSARIHLQKLSSKYQHVKCFHHQCCARRNFVSQEKPNSGQINVTLTGLVSVSRRHFHKTQRRCLAQVIDGRSISAEVHNEVKADLQTLVTERGRPPSLSVILVGEDPASQIYVRNKVKAASLTGIQSEEVKLPASVSQTDLLTTIQHLNLRTEVDAILVQLPLPPHIEERVVCDAVTQSKDVDGFHVVHMGRLLSDVDTILPCTPAAVLEILRRTGIETCGKKVTLVGRSKHVCLPLAILLQADRSKLPTGGDATVTICHRNTPQELLTQSTQSADIIISGTGIPRLITGDMVKEGVAVIDVGFSMSYNHDTGKSKLVGDVDFEGVSQKATYITPVPGGVGPVTVAMLMKNTLRLARGDFRTLPVYM
ncbi:bifunctional methylenetetrahydrofolate dehydrogenase/cyclohydrolase, mitochondrial-like [Liolophura sinensis]|uniref:bifunctional methylenetetrahydrofolate dehydrogenase/cyclohydrolase, mitochondrial-like n=1 Tax=Liolophura sinensis TaxID=3198878 RepID=UPI003158E53D